MKHDPAVISWEEVSRAFAPFAGSCLYAIRADTFFHLALRANSPTRFVLKNLLYPMALAARSKATGLERRSSRTGSFLFVCDYPAEAGFGSLRPLLRTCPTTATVVVNSAVFAARHRELGEIPGVSLLHADAPPDSDWAGSWRRCQGDYRALLSGSSSRLRRLLKASRLVLAVSRLSLSQLSRSAAGQHRTSSGHYPQRLYFAQLPCRGRGPARQRS